MTAHAARAAKSDLAPLPSLRPGIYRHFKGGIYQVFRVTRDANHDGRVTVLYAPMKPDLTTGEPWVRTYEDFHALVPTDGEGQTPRFEFLASGPTPDIQCELRERAKTAAASAMSERPRRPHTDST